MTARTSGNSTGESARRLCLSALLFGAMAIHSGTTPLPVMSQVRTFDLSDSLVAAVIPTEYDGGFFARIGDVVVNDLGIWVSDPGHNHVLRFDATGLLLAEFGREGSGPGEFLVPFILTVDSLLTIDDPRQGRHVRFRADGTHKETTRVRHFAGPHGGEIPLGRAYPLRGGFTVGMIPATLILGRDDPDGFLNTIVLLDPVNQSADTLFSYRSMMAAWQTEAIAGGQRTPFGAAGSWVALGDSAVAFADGTAGTLTVLTPGPGSPRTNSLDLGLAAREVTDRDIANLEATIREGRDLPRRMEIDAPSHWSVATSIIPDGDQVFWLRQAVDGDNQEWVVVNLATRDRWRVILPRRFHLTDVHGRCLYGVTRDELDLPSVGALVNPVATDLPGSRHDKRTDGTKLGSVSLPPRLQRAFIH